MTKVENGSLPPRGTADAVVTLVMVFDDECPFCRESEATVKELLAGYPGKLKLSYRDLPLEFHAQAQPDLEAVTFLPRLR